MPSAPTPHHILRTHSSPLSSLSFSSSNTHLYASDQDGSLSISDLRSLRTTSYWKAHEGGALGIQEWAGGVISHGRDNKLHIYEQTSSLPSISTPGPSRQHPAIKSSMDVNSLNFCRFSLTSSPKTKDEAYIAVPNLSSSETVDIYHLPSSRRIHSSIGYIPNIKTEAGRGGLIMALHLAVKDERLVLVIGFEDGRVEVWACGVSSLEKAWDGRIGEDGVWSKLWGGKKHNEAVMGMAVNRQLSRIFTISADHLLVRYDLTSILSGIPSDEDVTVISSHSTGQIGNSSIAINHPGQVVAVGGWDGKIRLFSASSFKSLGTLVYHRETVHALAFANPSIPAPADKGEGASTIEIGRTEADEDSEGEDGVGGGIPRERWLVSGGKDKRIAIWALMDFDGAKRET